MKQSTAALLAGLLVFVASIPLLIIGMDASVVSASYPVLDGKPTATFEATPTSVPVSQVLVRGVVPTQTIGKTQEAGVPMYVRVSHYNPKLGGTNCFSFVNGECVSKMSSQEPWQDWMDKACACPPEWPFGTTVTIEGRVWACMDRGGAIKFKGGIPWVDLLQEVADYPFGKIVMAEVALP